MAGLDQGEVFRSSAHRVGPIGNSSRWRLTAPRAIGQVLAAAAPAEPRRERPLQHASAARFLQRPRSRRPLARAMTDRRHRAAPALGPGPSPRPRRVTLPATRHTVGTALALLPAAPPARWVMRLPTTSQRGRGRSRSPSFAHQHRQALAGFGPSPCQPPGHRDRPRPDGPGASASERLTAGSDRSRSPITWPLGANPKSGGWAATEQRPSAAGHSVGIAEASRRRLQLLPGVGAAPHRQPAARPPRNVSGCER